MIRAKTESSADVIGWIETERSAYGGDARSLSFRRSRCGHANCPTCLSGSSIRAMSVRPTQRTPVAVYVPEDLVGRCAAVDKGVPADLLCKPGALRQGVEGGGSSPEAQEELSRGASGAADQLCGCRLMRQGVRWSRCWSDFEVP